MSTNKTANLTMNSWIGTDSPKRTEFNANFDIIDKELGQQNYKKVKTSKDSNKIYTVETWYLKGTSTKVRDATLSGGTSPSYTTLTVRDYASDGTTVTATRTWTLTYDGDGDLSQVVPN